MTSMCYATISLTAFDVDEAKAMALQAVADIYPELNSAELLSCETDLDTHTWTFEYQVEIDVEEPADDDETKV